MIEGGEGYKLDYSQTPENQNFRGILLFILFIKKNSKKKLGASARPVNENCSSCIFTRCLNLQFLAILLGIFKFSISCFFSRIKVSSCKFFLKKIANQDQAFFEEKCLIKIWKFQQSPVVFLARLVTSSTCFSFGYSFPLFSSWFGSSRQGYQLLSQILKNVKIEYWKNTHENGFFFAIKHFKSIIFAKEK